MNLFTHSWATLRAAVADLPIQAFAQPSGCAGWLVRDLVCHLIIDAQDVLITLATPSDQAPTHDAVTYWKLLDSPPTGRDPLDALIVRLAAVLPGPQSAVLSSGRRRGRSGTRRRARRRQAADRHQGAGPHHG
ncbi:maleylpyruvate isomerase N-terminal domain-containing protein [Mycobacteroides abscessus]